MGCELGRTACVRDGECVVRGGGEGSGLWRGSGCGASSVEDARNDGGNGAENGGDGGHVSSTVLVRIVPSVADALVRVCDSGEGRVEGARAGGLVSRALRPRPHVEEKGSRPLSRVLATAGRWAEGGRARGEASCLEY